MSVPFVSIVVPVLRDAPELERLLDALAGQGAAGVAGSDPSSELIVANGDGADPDVAALRRRFPGVRWTASDPGRGRQLNAGARLASGEWLLFLHADTCPEPGWRAGIARAAQDPRVVGGALRFTLRSDARAARLVERGVAWRVRWLGLPYGDQGIFVRRAVFEQVGGCRPLPLMEDVDLVRRLRRRGRMAHLRTPILVSPRRWDRDGWLRRTASNLLLLVLYCVGVSPERLARCYYGTPRRLAGAAPERPAAAAGTERPPPAAADRRVTVVIPALDEAEAIGQVLAELPDFVAMTIVVDNGSTDATADVARAAGATVVREPRRGYGRACAAGLAASRDAGVVVFLDADRSDYPAEMAALVRPVLDGEADLVMGRRDGRGRPLAARFGTALCLALINWLWGSRYRDLGPFRAIRREALDRLRMADRTYGWTIEMQVKAVEAGLRVLELPIRQRPRIGRSKVSGTLVGALRAGTRMLWTIWSLRRTRAARAARSG